MHALQPSSTEHNPFPGPVALSADQPVFGRDQPQAQRADIRTMRQLGRFQHLAPGKHRIAGEKRADMPAAIDRGDVKRVCESVEGQRARQ